MVTHKLDPKFGLHNIHHRRCKAALVRFQTVQAHVETIELEYRRAAHAAGCGQLGYNAFLLFYDNGWLTGREPPEL